jgi:hypothetical protein
VNNNSDTLASFYISGIDSIKKVNQKLRIKSSEYGNFCGCDYIIYQTKGNKIIRYSNLNLECNSAEVDGKPFYLYIDSTLNIPKSGKIFSESVLFEDLNDARKIFSIAIKDQKIIVPKSDKYLWYKFDGSFMIKVDLFRKEFIKLLNSYKIKYEIETICDTDEYHIFTIYSNYDLYEKLVIGYKWKWEPYYKVSIYMISTNKGEIDKYKKR